MNGGRRDETIATPAPIKRPTMTLKGSAKMIPIVRGISAKLTDCASLRTSISTENRSARPKAKASSGIPSTNGRS